MTGRKFRGSCLGVLAAALLLGGCTKSQINYQVAEAIGTLGQYENNEPVETPKMRQERELREQQQSEQEQHDAVMGEARQLAAGYFYDEAITLLMDSGIVGDDVEEALAAYRREKSDLESYTGDIVHLCFPTLIADTALAFDGDANSAAYAASMITISEFTAILESMYDNDYILVDLHDVAYLETDDEGISTMEMNDLTIPEGKKPLIISQDNVNYADVVNGDGIATKLVLDSAGQVKAVYTDEEGHDLTGDYDLIPVLESFIAEHPDFSYRGAKGIVSLSGSQGVFGYDIGSGSEITDRQQGNRETVAKIAQALVDQGWDIACAGYTHGYLNSLSADSLEDEITLWEDNVGVMLENQTDMLFYPYGAEVEYPSDQLEVLLEHGLVYLSGLWADQDFLEQGDEYLRQTRRFIDGETLQYSSDYFSTFFDASSIVDDNR